MGPAEQLIKSGEEEGITILLYNDVHCYIQEEMFRTVCVTVGR